ncbi:MAG: L,D-transpeptidase family protein [Rhizobiaceae bacterium]|nr:L,D-transpeptidase family protein [Rhizobiaceae bacterium]
MLALILSACSSTSSSTSGYLGASISSISAKKKAASKTVKTTKSVLRKARKQLDALERREARDDRRLKRKKISKTYRAKLEARKGKRKVPLRNAKRDVKKAKTAYDRALRAERRAQRRLKTAQRRKDASERRAAAAKKRKLLAQEKRKNSSSGKITSAFAGGLFRSSDPALKNINDYRARTDGDFKLAAIPVKKLDKRLLRQQVKYRTRHKVGTLVVDPKSKYLYLIQSGGKAMRYGIGVGKAGFEWSGAAHVGWKQKWPTWTPPEEMIARKRSLRKWSAKNGGMPGGVKNPLGARALYLMQGRVDTLYRLHGTPEWKSIGTAAPSGCIRLMNQDVIDLYKRVPNGTKVVVL